MKLIYHKRLQSQGREVQAGKFKVQNPKFKQSPKFKPMKHMEQESDSFSFEVDSFV